MENDDKPFECTVPGCSQRFANNDHLVVHKQKHQLKLQLGPHKAGELSAVDQTPTPTRFLKNCDEAGLFDEIHIHSNPFDQDFKRAVQVTEDIHTTTVTPVTASVLSHTSQANGNSESIVVIENSLTTESIPAISTVTEVSTRPLTVSQPAREQNKINISVPASVLVRAPHAHSTIPSVIPVSIANPNAPVQPALPVPGHLKRTSSMPISIPTPAIVTSPSAANPPSFIGSAKQRLKEQLRQQHVNNQFGGGNNNIISRAMTEAVDMVTSQHNGLPSQLHSHSQPQAQQSQDHKPEVAEEDYQHEQKRVGKRPRRLQEDLDPDERRRRFLERNRAAATRCREKRKIWVTQLEKKADDLTLTNTQLQNEISLLRTEVAQLKSLLLAHKDCPVTIAQQKMGTTAQLLNQGVVQSNGHPGNSEEDLVTSALTQMANRASLELGNLAGTTITSA